MNSPNYLNGAFLPSGLSERFLQRPASEMIVDHHSILSINKRTYFRMHCNRERRSPIYRISCLRIYSYITRKYYLKYAFSSWKRVLWKNVYFFKDAPRLYGNVLCKCFLMTFLLHFCLQCRRPGFSLWVRKIHWRREWLPTSVFLPGESKDREAWQAMVHRVAKSWT